MALAADLGSVLDGQWEWELARVGAFGVRVRAATDVGSWRDWLWLDIGIELHVGVGTGWQSSSPESIHTENPQISTNSLECTVPAVPHGSMRLKFHCALCQPIACQLEKSTRFPAEASHVKV